MTFKTVPKNSKYPTVEEGEGSARHNKQREEQREIETIFKFIEIALQHGCSPVNLLHIFRRPFSKNISGWLLP